MSVAFLSVSAAAFFSSSLTAVSSWGRALASPFSASPPEPGPSMASTSSFGAWPRRKSMTPPATVSSRWNSYVMRLMARKKRRYAQIYGSGRWSAE